MQLRLQIATATMILCSLGFAQAPANKPAGKQPGAAKSAPQRPAASQKNAKADQQNPKVAAKQKFVLDVVRSAVALPQPDQQDRLRVLATAASVAMPIDRNLSKQFAKEGARIESELIARGEQPSVSMLAQGQFDCASAVQFVESIPTEAVSKAEQSLIGVISNCQKTGIEPAKRKLLTALDNGVVAPRALMALVESQGAKSRWSQDVFSRMFSSLPSAQTDAAKKEAPNYAAMYIQMAPQIDKDVAKQTGLKFLEWLNKVPEGNERTMAVNMASGAMREALGEEAYSRALESNVVARQVASQAGQQADIQHDPEESVSVLGAMGNTGADRTSDIATLAPSLRAREAAAHGFASGTSGDRKQADRYFDIAFAAADEVWAKRSERNDAPAVIEEISEAAAQVDAVAALQRTQGLNDPSAQAIGMLAVARTVLGRQDDAPLMKPVPGTPGSPIR